MLGEGRLCLLYHFAWEDSHLIFVGVLKLVRLDDIEVELASTNLHQVKIVQLMQWEANLLLQVVTMNPPFFDKHKSVGCFRE